MSTDWTLTFDCANPGAQAAFWQLDLGYVDDRAPRAIRQRTSAVTISVSIH